MSPLRAALAVVAAAALFSGGFALGRALDATEPGRDVLPTLTSTPTTSATPAPCAGEVPPRAGGGTWVCTFSDEFDGDSLDTSKWTVLKTSDSRFTNGGECFVDTPDNLAVSDGNLHLTLRKVDEPVSCPGLATGMTSYTSASVTTAGNFAQAYGRFEFRAAFATADVPGLHGALWLWPQNQTKYGANPASGEIDVAEFYTAYPDRVIPVLHYRRLGPSPAVTNTNCLVDRPEEYHVYTLEWTPSQMTITYDDKVCMSAGWRAFGLLPPAPFDMPFFLNLTQALGNRLNQPTPETPLPATMKVDYVRVWS